MEYAKQEHVFTYKFPVNYFTIKQGTYMFCVSIIAIIQRINVREQNNFVNVLSVICILCVWAYFYQI